MEKRHKYLWATGGILALLLLLPRRGNTSPSGVSTLSYLGKCNSPKGICNNNPGNIRIGNSAWKGKVPLNQNTDGAFEQFYTYAYGIRAMIKNLLSYYASGLNTLQNIIYKWAPPADNNDTPAYVAFVALKTGFSAAQPLNLRDRHTMQKIVTAMAEMENGRPSITSEQFNYAWNIL